MNTSIVLLIIIAVVVVTYLVSFAKESSEEATPVPGDTEPKKISSESVDLVALADKIDPVMQKMSHPSDILSNVNFEKAVSALASKNYTIQQCGNYAFGTNWILGCVGYEALSRRDDSVELVERAVKAAGNVYAWPLFFLIRFVDAKASEPFAGRVISSAQSWWSNNTQTVETIGDCLRRRIDSGEKVDFGTLFTESELYEKEDVRKFINALPDDVRDNLNSRLKEHEGSAIDRKFLASVGEILSKDHLNQPVFDTRQIAQLRLDMQGELDLSAPRSILIVGPSGVGKTALRRAYGNDLLDTGWHVFKTSAANLIADKVYIGEIEGQLKKLSANASVAKRVAIYVDRISELSDFGKSSGNKNSVLDQLWPMIESREMFLVSETTSNGLQALARKYPSLPTVMKVINMQAIEEDEAGDMAQQLLEYLYDGDAPEQQDEVVSETMQLAQQYLSHKSMPGSVLTLLELAVLRARREGDDALLNRVHVLGALSQISGLPKEVLDDKQQLDIDSVSASFRARVIGQDEAVTCLVERIAMLKAGLTDPSRPVGVFLFAGPTGTGKTEIAKTLAELLFGSSEQMIRLDMSEYQDPDSVWRILGQNNEEAASGTLVSRVREQPFSVVLLDEFEKAHSKVWDLFLQVFDDGRLSDARGDLVDFRHTIIILTSNLGATISNEAGVGFTSTSGGFSASDVLRTVNRTFRREFINRLDRVVVFRPLSREVMRAILRKELEKALGRRGLRTKQWAVEWEDSAVEFLLAEGFTPDLGARPLRRAIERHLLAPLSITMVQNRAPDGEQFLFIRSNGEELQVEFMDPDADPETEVLAEGITDRQSTTDPNLPDIMISTSIADGATEFLSNEMAQIANRIENDKWASEKASHIAQLNRDGFWERDDRYDVLDRIELIDRLDSAASVLGSLSERLRQHQNNTKLVRSIANRLFVLQEGLQDLDLNRPTQAYLGIRLVTADADFAGATEFLHDLVGMYQNWARARGMRLRELDVSNSRYEALFTVSGFGSFGALVPESGLHVLETPRNQRQFDRVRVRVQVAPVPVAAADKQINRGAKATATLDESAGKVEIVRRYRLQPSPLVRDSVRGWRTGRLDQVLAGNFDLLS